MPYQLPALCALILVSSISLAAPAPPTARSGEQLEHMMGKRHAVQKVSGPKASPAELRAAAARFEALLGELEQGPMGDLADGNQFLRAEHLNILLPLAEVYARLDMKEQALGALERSQAVAWIPSMAKLDKNPAFAALVGEPRFAAVMARGRLGKAVFDAPAIASAYKEKLSVEERIAGLSLFWHEARQNFVYFDHVPDLEWDKVYLDYLGKVMAASTTREYYDVMMRLGALLQDGHTNVSPPREISNQFYSRPPVRTALVEDKVIVLTVSSPSLDKLITTGDEILAIDGMPVKDYARERVAPLVSSSTPQDRLVRMYAYQLLAGAADVPVRVALAGADGKRREITLQRSGYTDLRKQAQFEFRMLKDVAYFSLDHFESDEGVKAFEAALPAIMKARALIIDVRNNGGGSTSYGHRILQHLSNKPIVGAASFIRTDDGFSRARYGNHLRWKRVDDRDPDAARTASVFTGPVAVLAGPRSFSAAEDFLLAYELLERGPIVGEATGGSTGQPMQLKLPGGGSARICVKRDMYPDGREFVGKGVLPTIEARPTVQGVRSGHDPVLARAIEALARKSGI